MDNKKGFTLTELLTAVIIISILVVMAVPLYEKTIERSRMAEARTILNRLQAAKHYTMEMMECDTYSTTASDHCPMMKHLNVAFAENPNSNGYTFSTKDFSYSLLPGGTVTGVSTPVNGVCAKRLSGDYAGTLFFYYGEDSNNTPVFACKGTSCEAYGFENTNTFTCSGV